ncbi:hypothetical protein PanWU01x14_224500 [Parasponia andersonii]|uniref:Uncharacterized protein n=1 Tax=Parasponia andersonii TaxID=3476 RepID=A0A2P5BND2_PARAD|nr:hypothetical protein PanWU01x14_224500 [Parasponia andersonii]
MKLIKHLPSTGKNVEEKKFSLPHFLSDEDFSSLRHDAVSVADRADAFIRDLQKELDTVRAQADAAAITDQQTCSLLEQKYLSHLQFRNADAPAPVLPRPPPLRARPKAPALFANH